MEVYYLPEVAKEREKLSVADRVALDHAVENLEQSGAQLPFPHQSKVKDADRLRELRPQGGRSRFRAFYRQVGDLGRDDPDSVMLIGSLGPDAKVDKQGFQTAVRRAEKRLNAF